MKFRVTMKDPDGVYDSIDDAVNEQLRDTPDDERQALRDIRFNKAQDVASKWFEYGEYLTVEIDTDANTCTVIEAKS